MNSSTQLQIISALLETYWLDKLVEHSATVVYDAAEKLVAFAGQLHEEHRSTSLTHRLEHCPPGCGVLRRPAKHPGHDEADVMARGLLQDVAPNTPEESKPDVRVSFEHRAHQIDGQMIVEQSEASLCSELNADGVFADRGWAVQEYEMHLEKKTNS